MNRRTVLYAAAGATVLGLSSLLLSNHEPTSAFSPLAVPQANAQAESPEAFAETEAALRERGFLVGEVTLGDENAPVTMVEYVSLTCPACRAFHENTMPGLKAQYIDEGQLKVVTREVIGNRMDLYASAVARCSGRPQAYHAFISVLLDRQSDWIFGIQTQEQITQGVEALRRLAVIGGLTDARFNECLTDNEYLNYLLQRYIALQQVDQIEATPTLFIDGERIRGAASIDQVSSVIESKL